MWPFTILFSPDTPLLLRFVVSLLIVIGLLVLGLYLLKKYAPGVLKVVAQKNTARLELVSAQAIDGRRMLMIVRRDDVEHLVMIGGPNDLLIESGFACTQSKPTLEDDTPALRGGFLENDEIEGAKPAPSTVASTFSIAPLSSIFQSKEAEPKSTNEELAQRLSEVLHKTEPKTEVVASVDVENAALSAVASTLAFDVEVAPTPAETSASTLAHTDEILNEMKELLGRKNT